ncbi:MAG: PAS domain S-box protein, partial [Devosia sp.]
MGSLRSWLGGNWRQRLSSSSGGRPEALRRKAIASTAAMVLGISLIGMPGALYLLVQGALLPFVITMVGVATGTIAVMLSQRGQFERAAAAQVYATLLSGFLLTVADPAVADFGLAVALLAPVHASLLTRTPVKKRAWAILVVVVAAGVAAAMGLLVWPEAFRAEFALLGAMLFVVIAGLIAYSANRLNSVFEVYEKGQINAYKHLIEHVQDAVMRFGSDGSVLFVSRSAEKLFGCRRFELTGSGLVDRI